MLMRTGQRLPGWPMRSGVFRGHLLAVREQFVVRLHTPAEGPACCGFAAKIVFQTESTQSDPHVKPRKSERHGGCHQAIFPTPARQNDCNSIKRSLSESRCNPGCGNTARERFGWFPCSL